MTEFPRPNNPKDHLIAFADSGLEQGFAGNEIASLSRFELAAEGLVSFCATKAFILAAVKEALVLDKSKVPTANVIEVEPAYRSKRNFIVQRIHEFTPSSIHEVAVELASKLVSEKLEDYVKEAPPGVMRPMDLPVSAQIRGSFLSDYVAEHVRAANSHAANWYCAMEKEWQDIFRIDPTLVSRFYRIFNSHIENLCRACQDLIIGADSVNDRDYAKHCSDKIESLQVDSIEWIAEMFHSTFKQVAAISNFQPFSIWSMQQELSGQDTAAQKSN